VTLALAGERYRGQGISGNGRNGVSPFNPDISTFLDWGGWLLEGIVKW
jgi:hypothetical protein